MEEGRAGHCAIAGFSDIYIVGGYHNSDSFKIFNTVSLLWKTAVISRKMPVKKHPVAVWLKGQYLVMIGEFDIADSEVSADCLIYDVWSKHWFINNTIVHEYVQTT